MKGYVLIRWLTRVAATLLLAGPHAAQAQTSPATARPSPPPPSAPQPWPQSQPASRPASEPAPGEALDRELTPEAAQAEITRLESAENLPDSVRAQFIDLYRQILKQAQSAADWRARAAELDAAARRAPEQIAAVRTRLAPLTSQPIEQPASDAARPDLEKDLALAQADLASAKQEAGRLTDQLTLRAERRKAIPDLLKKAGEQLDGIAADLDARPPADEPADVTLARRKLLLTRKKALEAEKALYDGELRDFDLLNELSTLLRDEAAQKTRRAEQRIDAWQRAVNEARRIETEKQAEVVRKEAETAPGTVADLANVNAELAEKRTELTAKLDDVQAESNRLKEQLKDLEARFSGIRDKVRVADATPGLIASIGPIMRLARAQIPDQRRLETRVRAVQELLGQVTLDTLDVSDRLTLVTDRFEDEVKLRLSALDGDPGPPQRARHEETIRRMIATQRELLTALKKDYGAYFNTLFDISREYETLIAESGEFAQFIDEKVLWIRSAEPLWKTPAPRSWRAPVEAWIRASGALVDDVFAAPYLYAAAGVALAALLWVRRRGSTWLKRIGDRATGAYSDSFQLTLQALVITLFRAAIWPAFIGFLAWRASLAGAQDSVVAGVAAGLFLIAGPLFFLDALRLHFAPGGIAEKHFLWRPEACRALRLNLLWFMVVVLPAPAIVNNTEPVLGDEWRDTFARAVFILAMLAVAVFAHRVASPGGVVLGPMFERDRGWLHQLRFPMHALIVLTPVALAIAAALGYLYTAVQLNRRLMLTIWLLVGVVLAHAFVVRWLFVEQRRLAIAQFRKMRAAQEAARQAGETTSDAPVLEEAAIDLVRVDAQTRRLVKSGAAYAVVIGVFLIWLDMMPAFRFLTRHQVWTHAVQVAGESAAPNGGAALAPTIKYVAVTYADLAIALIVCSATLILGRNIPGLLEIAILQRLPLEPAGRYAVTTVSRYVITVVGIIIMLGVLGVQWTDVQWLAAAITVGLGFGLQEIFANFVSGLIILFERPVRVGDVVTVGAVSGTVTRIRIRATTILDWNRKELIVPNREFITGQVVNWTLTDSTLRVTVPVGVAYGSDIALTRRLLLKIAEHNDKVLEEPHPQVFFLSFGASALNFELRVFVRHPEESPAVTDALHTAIAAEFARAGIEIAYPQMDVNVRSLDAVLKPGAGAGEIEPRSRR